MAVKKAGLRKTEKKKAKPAESVKKTPVQKAVMGRPSKNEKDGDPEARAKLLKLVESLGSIGVTQEEMAHILDVSVKTVERWMSEKSDQYDPDFCGCYKRGASTQKMSLRRKQIDLANAGNVTMLVWLGKNWLGQTDKAETAHTLDLKSAVDRFAEAAGIDPDDLLAKAREIADDMDE